MYGRFVEVLNVADYNAAMALTKGKYQRDILNGYEALSGSTLKGKAVNWRDRYKRSSNNLLVRCIKAGIKLSVQVREPGHKRVLVIGA